jgi:hypothetical protein
MTITYPITIPLKEYAEVSWAGMSVVSNPRSAFTGRGQVQVFDGQWWEARVTWPQLGADLGSPLTAFVLALNSAEGTFLLGDPSHVNPRGQAKNNASTPLVNGSEQTGNQLSIKNGPLALTAWLAPGDLLQVGASSTARLHKVISSVDTDGNGLATIDIWPRHKSPPVDNGVVVIIGAQGLFRLNQPGSEWSVSPPTNIDQGFSCIEAF